MKFRSALVISILLHTVLVPLAARLTFLRGAMVDMRSGDSAIEIHLVRSAAARSDSSAGAATDPEVVPQAVEAEPAGPTSAEPSPEDNADPESYPDVTLAQVDPVDNETVPDGRETIAFEPSPAPASGASQAGETGNNGADVPQGEPGTSTMPDEFSGDSSRMPLEWGGGSPESYASASIDISINRPPEYPQEARARGYEGRVLIKVRVKADGTAQEIIVLRSSGHQILDDACKAAVALWKFVPARLSGRPIGSWLLVPFRFSLTEPEKPGSPVAGSS